HTRFSRDWSSDVCSSDLPGPATASVPGASSGAASSWNLVWVDGLLLPCPSQENNSGRGPIPVLARRECRRTPAGAAASTPESRRSEERRVGKECRERGWA